MKPRQVVFADTINGHQELGMVKRSKQQNQWQEHGAATTEPDIFLPWNTTAINPLPFPDIARLTEHKL